MAQNATTETPNVGAAATSKTNENATIAHAVKIAGERVTPGASLILDGNMRLGILHSIGALLAARFLGPAAAGYVALNSYSKSTSGKHLHEHLFPKS